MIRRPHFQRVWYRTLHPQQLIISLWLFILFVTRVASFCCCAQKKCAACCVAYFLVSCASCSRKYFMCLGGNEQQSRLQVLRVLRTMPIVEYFTVFTGFMLAIIPSLFAFFNSYCCLSFCSYGCLCFAFCSSLLAVLLFFFLLCLFLINNEWAALFALF